MTTQYILKNPFPRKNPPIYIGRFAPTPSGALHFGSLVTALGSYLDAKAHKGRWLLRIEDIDRNRSQRQAITTIYHQLETLQLHWDGEIRLQSQHLNDYTHALTQLQPHLYYCACSRKDWQPTAPQGALGAIYPRHCQNQKTPPPQQNSAIRLSLPFQTAHFYDRLLGCQQFTFQKDLGDPILRRRDGDIAYALAVVVDDALQHITHIVRGQDLLATTVLQNHLQTLLNLPRPTYLHLPLALTPDRQKLSKQNHAPPIDLSQPSQTLAAALTHLGQPLPENPHHLTPAQLLTHAITHWQIHTIPKHPQIVL